MIYQTIVSDLYWVVFNAIMNIANLYSSTM